MARIKVETPTPEQVAEMGRLPVWEKEASVFEWFYEQPEVCYLLAGRVRVTTEDGETAEFGAGDLVSFPSGLGCTWEIREAVRKHYRLG